MFKVVERFKWFSWIGIALVTLFSVACEVGLGAAIDMEAPVLSITSHENLAYVGAEFVLSGTVTDNVAVSRVVISDTASDATIATALISGSSWSAALSLEEGERVLRVRSYDARNNSSWRSVADITVLVDATPPFISGVEIARGGGSGMSVIPRAKEDLEGLSSQAFIDNDYLQNESFTVSGIVDDGFDLSSVVLSLHGEDGQPVLENLPNSASNHFKPVWHISHAMLIAADPELASGRHYLRLSITAVDAGGNSGETNTDQFLWLCWYPDGDIPKIMPGMIEDGRISVPKESNIPLEIWDDDGLSEAWAVLLSLDEWAEIVGATDTDKLNTLLALDDKSSVFGQNLVSGNDRSLLSSFYMGTQSGSFKLVCLAQDAKEEGTGVWQTLCTDVLLSDADAPVTIISSPEANTFPALTDGQYFSVSGYTLDNRGTSDLKMAWIPEGLPGDANSVLEAAKDALRQSSVASGSVDIQENGMRIWTIELGAATNQVIHDKTYKRKAFSKQFDILSDLMYQDELQNATKTFLLRSIDEDENEVFTQLRLLGNSRPCTITVQSPANDLYVHNLGDDLMLSFQASSVGGLGISRYELWDISDADTENHIQLPLSEDGELRYATIGSVSLTEGRRTYSFIAEDALGNIGIAQRTVILSSLPELLHISSSMTDRTWKAGDTLLLQAVFSASVRVEGNPRLRVRYSAVDTVERFAEYSSGSGTDTLIFSFTVPVGAESAALRSMAAPLDLNGGSIETTEGDGGDAFIPGLAGFPMLAEDKLLQHSKTLGLDGIAPVPQSISIASGNYKQGESFEVRVQVSEPLIVSGSPVLRLLGEDSAELLAQFVRTDGTDIVFTYTVPSGASAHPISWNTASCFSAADRALMTDSAGNILLAGTTSGNSTANIDTLAPAAPVLSISAGQYNTGQTLSLSNLEAGANSWISTDGGVSWVAYNGSGHPLSNGSYLLSARQFDAAGNMSANAAIQSVSINSEFPSLSAISCEQPNGVYAAGSELSFKLVFSDTVRTINGSAVLTVSDEIGSPSAAVPITQDADGASSLYFSWVVPGGMEMSNISITALSLDGVVDMFGNSAGTVSIPSLNRPGIRVDSVAPQISGRVPALNGVLARDGEGNSIITLTFNEEVYPESGSVSVYRYGNWLIPPVLSEAEFSAVYNSSALSTEQRNTLRATENGRDVLHEQTGQAIGPYKKSTHGILASGGVWVPDTATKFVLDFENDLDDPDLRAVFEATGYHSYTVDVSSFRVTGGGTTTITISLPEALPHGREWTLTLDAGSFRDSAGNTSAAIAAGDYTFWSDKVARPVVRVDRYSHGWGASAPQVSGGSITGYAATVGDADVTTAPSGWVRVRIDSETPGAQIEYGILAKSSSTVDFTNYSTPAEQTPPENDDDYTGYFISSNADATLADILDISIDIAWDETLAANYLPIGDDSLETARKDYVAAQATRDAASGLPALSASDTGLEGVFKSLVVYRNPVRTQDLRFQGSTVRGGVPTISAFPLKDADRDIRFSKYAYLREAGGNRDWFFPSWEIVSDWYATSVTNNWQRSYTRCRYGEYAYKLGQNYW